MVTVEVFDPRLYTGCIFFCLTTLLFFVVTDRKEDLQRRYEIYSIPLSVRIRVTVTAVRAMCEYWGGHLNVIKLHFQILLLLLHESALTS
jgi:hypothetical protein